MRRESHDLADGDGDIGILWDGLIAPSAFGILRVDDEADGELNFFLEIGARAHAVDFGEEEGGEAVAVHGRAVVLGGDESGFLAVFEDEGEDFFDIFAVGTVVGEVSVGDECEAGEGHDGGGVAAAGVDGSVGGEVFGEEVEASVDARVEFGGEFVFDGESADGGGLGGGGVGGGGLGVRGEGGGEGGADHKREDACPRCPRQRASVDDGRTDLLVSVGHGLSFVLPISARAW